MTRKRHWWERCHGVLIGSHYEPPPQHFRFDGAEVRGRGLAAREAADRLAAVYEKALEGVTTLTWRCPVCGDVWTTTQPGRATGHAEGLA